MLFRSISMCFPERIDSRADSNSLVIVIGTALNNSQIQILAGSGIEAWKSDTAPGCGALIRTGIRQGDMPGGEGKEIHEGDKSSSRFMAKGCELFE